MKGVGIQSGCVPGILLFSYSHYILVYILLYFLEMGTIFTPKWVPIFFVDSMKVKF